jgi:hypothetical protein
MTPTTRCGGSLAVALLLAGSAAAADWSSTNAQLLHGSGFELGLETRDILTSSTPASGRTARITRPST